MKFVLRLYFNKLRLGRLHVLKHPNSSQDTISKEKHRNLEILENIELTSVYLQIKYPHKEDTK